jgi:hypothetical protein
MARTTSTRSRNKAVEETPAEIATETPEATPAEVSTEAEEATTVSTDTVEPEVTETPVSDTTEATTETTSTPAEDADKAKAEAEADQKVTDYEAVVATALADRDVSTGDVPVVNLEAVKTAFREITGAKYRKRAKDHLNDQLKSFVNGQDIIGATAIMHLVDAVDHAGPNKSDKAPAKPTDPAEAYREAVAAAHLAYNLVRADVPEGLDQDAELAKVEELVGALVNDSQNYLAWSQSTAEDKGDEPEVSPIVKRAVKLATGKAARAARPKASATGERTPRTGGNRSVRTHIAQAFGDEPSGTVKRISEIAKAKTDEYPDGDCSAGAVSAALKSAKGVEGYQLTRDESGVNVVTKL